jgi:hypothetical protein
MPMNNLEHPRQKVPASDQVTFFSHPVTITGSGVYSVETRHCLVSTPSTEPYYQLMRQTLLAYEMTKAKE